MGLAYNNGISQNRFTEDFSKTIKRMAKEKKYILTITYIKVTGKTILSMDMEYLKLKATCILGNFIKIQCMATVHDTIRILN